MEWGFHLEWCKTALYHRQQHYIKYIKRLMLNVQQKAEQGMGHSRETIAQGASVCAFGRFLGKSLAWGNLSGTQHLLKVQGQSLVIWGSEETGQGLTHSREREFSLHGVPIHLWTQSDLSVGNTLGIQSKHRQQGSETRRSCRRSPGLGDTQGLPSKCCWAPGDPRRTSFRKGANCTPD